MEKTGGNLDRHIRDLDYPERRQAPFTALCESVLSQWVGEESEASSAFLQDTRCVAEKS